MEESVGQQLRQARERRSVTLEQVARATHMRLHYLKAMEEGNFEAMPSITQARGFLRAYASYLNLDPEPLLGVINNIVQSRPTDPAKTEETPQPDQTTAGQEANAIFADVGQKVRSQRELLGLSLEDVIRHTHLQRHYLQALETGDLGGLPSPVQGRGMLKNYAAFLGLDPEPLLLQFAEGLQARLAVKQAATAAQAQPDASTRTQRKARVPRRISLRLPLPAPLRRLLSSDLLVGGILATFLVGFFVWGAIRIFNIQAEETPAPTAPPIAEVLLAPPSPSPTLTPTPDTPTPESAGAPVFPTQPSFDETDETAEFTPPPSGQQAVQVYITVQQRAWVRVAVDGDVEFEGRVTPGSAYSFAGEEQVEILSGNGAALQVFFNQQDLGPMGLFGEVVHQVFTEEGIVGPTPSVTPTGTATSPTTPTAEPSQTPGAGTATPPPLP